MFFNCQLRCSSNSGSMSNLIFRMDFSSNHKFWIFFGFLLADLFEEFWIFTNYLNDSNQNTKRKCDKKHRTKLETDKKKHVGVSCTIWLTVNLKLIFVFYSGASPRLTTTNLPERKSDIRERFLTSKDGTRKGHARASNRVKDKLNQTIPTINSPPKWPSSPHRRLLCSIITFDSTERREK